MDTMGYEDSHSKRRGTEGDGTWGPFLKAMQTGLVERATVSTSSRSRQSSFSECHNNTHSAGSLKYGPNPTAHGIKPPSSHHHDPHCTWGAFFQACSAGIKEDASTIRRRLSHLPLPPHPSSSPLSSPRPHHSGSGMSRSPSSPALDAADDDNSGRMTVDEFGEPWTPPSSAW